MWDNRSINQPYPHFSWVTDFTISKLNVFWIMRGGRAHRTGAGDRAMARGV
jgi:hypothetical protein